MKPFTLFALFLISCQIILAQQGSANTELMKKLKASEIRHDVNNEDGIMLVKKKKTKKWGMVQNVGHNIKIVVPFRYDSIATPDYNAEFIFVFQNNHAGLYLPERT